MIGRRSVIKNMVSGVLCIPLTPLVAKGHMPDNDDDCSPMALKLALEAENSSSLSAVIRIVDSFVCEVDGRTDITVKCLGLDPLGDGFHVWLYYGYEGYGSIEIEETVDKFKEGAIYKADGCFCFEREDVYYFFPVLTPYKGDIEIAHKGFDSYLEIVGDYKKSIASPIWLLKLKLQNEANSEF